MKSRMTRLIIAVTLLIPGVQLLAPPVAQATHLCVITTQDPVRSGDKVFGSVFITCTRAVEWIKVEAFITRTTAGGTIFEGKHNVRTCTATDKCDVTAQKNYVFSQGDLWHTWGDGAYEHDPEKRNKRQHLATVRSPNCVPL